jgi:molybdopterin-guanine dinucleotide biosynthesis protein A
VSEVAPAVEVAGVVLTGGASRRMGRDKALMLVDGVPMAVRVATAMIAAGAHPVVALGGDAGALAECGLEVVADRWPGEGPLGAIVTAFGWVPHDIAVIAACDLPWLDANVLQTLVDALEAGEADVAAARTDRREPLCAAWRVRRCRDRLAAAFVGGERAVHVALQELAVAEVDVAVSALHNVNTQADLDAHAPERPAE